MIFLLLGLQKTSSTLYRKIGYGRKQQADLKGLHARKFNKIYIFRFLEFLFNFSIPL